MHRVPKGGDLQEENINIRRKKTRFSSIFSNMFQSFWIFLSRSGRWADPRQRWLAQTRRSAMGSTVRVPSWVCA